MKNLRYNVTEESYKVFDRWCLDFKQQNNIDVSKQECLIYLLTNVPKVPILRPDSVLKSAIAKNENDPVWKKLTEDQRRTIKLISLGMLTPSDTDKKIIAILKAKA